MSLFVQISNCLGIFLVHKFQSYQCLGQFKHYVVSSVYVCVCIYEVEGSGRYLNELQEQNNQEMIIVAQF